MRPNKTDAGLLWDMLGAAQDVKASELDHLMQRVAAAEAFFERTPVKTLAQAKFI